MQSSVILETMRLSTGVTMRCPRVAPTEALVYEDYVIPAGVSIQNPETDLFSISKLTSDNSRRL